MKESECERENVEEREREKERERETRDERRENRVTGWVRFLSLSRKAVSQL